MKLITSDLINRVDKEVQSKRGLNSKERTYAKELLKSGQSVTVFLDGNIALDIRGTFEKPQFFKVEKITKETCPACGNNVPKIQLK